MALLRLSKNFVTKTIDDKKFELKKWSTWSTANEGTKLGKVLAPCWAVIADSYIGKSLESGEISLEDEDIDENMYILTKAVAQLVQHLDDEHVEDLYDKLLSCIVYPEDKDGKQYETWSDFYDVEGNEHLFEEFLVWSIKENLWDFFMKQATLRSKIEGLKKLVSPAMEVMTQKTESKEDGNTKS